jgi:hypothetical protein
MGESAAAEWATRSLRCHLHAVVTASGNMCSSLDLRQAAQRLQLSMNCSMLTAAAACGQHALLTNLATMLLQLLDVTEVPMEEVVSACVAAAGRLASKAEFAGNKDAACHHSVTDTSDDATASSALQQQQHQQLCSNMRPESRCHVLELASKLLRACTARVTAFQSSTDMSVTAPDDGLLAPLVAVEQQLLLLLAQAHYEAGEHCPALECITQLQGVAPGQPRVQGVVKLSSLALLRQGKADTAALQLSVWLEQGGQTATEAAEAIAAFARALGSELHGQQADSAAALVDGITAAACKRCRGDSDAALALVGALVELLQACAAALPVLAGNCLCHEAACAHPNSTFPSPPPTATTRLLLLLLHALHPTCSRGILG